MPPLCLQMLPLVLFYCLCLCAPTAVLPAAPSGASLGLWTENDTFQSEAVICGLRAIADRWIPVLAIVLLCCLPMLVVGAVVMYLVAVGFVLVCVDPC